MIFNVGARRSGTYWLQRIVTAHPRVAAVPSETHLISHGIAPLVERFHQGERDSTQVGSVYFERELMLTALRRLCDEVFDQFREPGQERVAERTPLHVFHLPLIAELYPDARIVHIIRDGRDVARSIAAQPWGPESVTDAAREWRDSVEAGRRAGLTPERYREVRYEALLADPQTEIASLYGWLGLEAGPAELAAALAESRREENVDARGIGGVASGKWRGGLDWRELEAFIAVAGTLLAELGYPLEADRGGDRKPGPRSLWRRLRARRRRGQTAAAGSRRAQREPGRR